MAAERRCVFHDAPWPEGDLWCQSILDRWHIDMDLDLTDCVTRASTYKCLARHRKYRTDHECLLNAAHDGEHTCSACGQTFTSHQWSLEWH